MTETYEQVIAQWQEHPITTAAELEQRLGSFPALFAYHSGKIENAAVSLRHIRSIFTAGRVEGYTGTPQTLFEMYNPKLCHAFLLPKIIAQEPLTVALVKEMHAILTAGTYNERRYSENGERPGTFKKHDYVVGADVGTAPEEVEHEVTALLEEMTELSELPDIPAPKLLKIVAYLHCRFEYFHPFADGNGRVGRSLLNYFLMTHRHPPLIVHEEDRSIYYDCLRAYDKEERIDLMNDFLIFSVEKTWADGCKG